MWILRQLTENVNVTCIPINEPFTIGRIDCIFNITNDKSVSRRHAIIRFNSQKQLIISDEGSKFGTFVNGVKVTGAGVSNEIGASGCILRNGDAIKFGGASSEFKIEHRDLSAFVSAQNTNIVHKLQALSVVYGFSVASKVSEAAYFILEDQALKNIESVGRDLIEAVSENKYIVTPSFYTQLLEASKLINGISTNFSFALIQPVMSGSNYSFPIDCWLPRPSRSVAIKNILEGVSKLICGDFETFQIVEIIGRSIGIDVELMEKSRVNQLNELAFNKVLVTSKETVEPSINQLTNSLRCVTFKSLMESYLFADGQLIDLETLYPKFKSTLNAKSEFINSEQDVDTLSCKISMIKPKAFDLVKSESIPVLASSTHSEEPENYVGPSLTAVVLMPSNYLRQRPLNDEITNPNGYCSSRSSTAGKFKFVKCHPKHYQPGTIPALIGPDQLGPSRAINSDSNDVAFVGSNQSGSLKRRILVKDSWLAEDDFVAVNDKREDLENISEFTDDKNKPKNNVKKTPWNEPVNKPISINHVPVSTLISSDRNDSLNDCKNSIDKNISSANASSFTSSKFQSSFFKNLSKDSNK